MVKSNWPAAALPGATNGPGKNSFSSKSSSPQNRLNPRPGQTPGRYLAWPIRDEAGRIQGHELVEISGELRGYLSRMARESRP